MINQLRIIENGYMELFCKRKSLQDIAYFTNDVVPELYDHNFVFVQSTSNRFTLLQKQGMNIIFTRN